MTELIVGTAVTVVTVVTAVTLVKEVAKKKCDKKLLPNHSVMTKKNYDEQNVW